MEHALGLFEANGCLIVGGCSFNETMGQGAQFAMRTVDHQQRFVRRIVKIKYRDVGAGIEFANFGMNDVVQGQQEGPGGRMILEKYGLLLAQDGHGAAAKPAQDFFRRYGQHVGGGADQLVHFVVGIAAHAGIRAVDAGGLQQHIPGVGTVVMGNDLFEKIKNNSFHVCP